MYDIKALYEAESVKDACELLLAHKDAQVLAGGSDVLVQIREGKRAGKEFVSIYMLDELRGVSFDKEKNIRIGSLTSFSHITNDPIIKKHINVLGKAVDMVGGPQIRAIGTIGGNTCNGVTSADSASTLFAYDSLVEITGVDYKRTVPISEFYIKPKVVDLKPGEIQTAIIIPKDSYLNTKGHYIKYAMRNALDIATLGCSVNVRLSSDKKKFDRVRVAFGVAGPIPLRSFTAENFLKGKTINENNIKSFAKEVLKDINPRDSWRAPKDFRLHVAGVMSERSLRESIKLSGGKA